MFALKSFEKLELYIFWVTTLFNYFLHELFTLELQFTVSKDLY